jgi:hypothetical protein
VTVESVHHDTGAVLATAAGVYAVKRARRRFPFSVGDGGNAGADLCRFVLLAAPLSALAVLLKHPDRITDAGGTVWVVDERGADLIAMGNLWTADVSRKRS